VRYHTVTVVVTFSVNSVVYPVMILAAEQHILAHSGFFFLTFVLPGEYCMSSNRPHHPLVPFDAT
jgi:hypothetical protein